MKIAHLLISCFKIALNIIMGVDSSSSLSNHYGLFTKIVFNPNSAFRNVFNRVNLTKTILNVKSFAISIRLRVLSNIGEEIIFPCKWILSNLQVLSSKQL